MWKQDYGHMSRSISLEHSGHSIRLTKGKVEARNMSLDLVLSHFYWNVLNACECTLFKDVF